MGSERFASLSVEPSLVYLFKRSIMVMLRTCCCCTVRQGCMVLGSIGTFGPVVGIVVLATSFHWILKVIEKLMESLSNTDYETAVLVEEATNKVQGMAIGIFSLVVIILAIDLLINILLIVGAVKGRKNFLLPWIVLQGLSIFATIGFAIFTMTRINWSMPEIGSIIGTLIGLLLNVYFELVVVSHYQELRDEDQRLENAPTEMQTRLTSQM